MIANALLNDLMQQPLPVVYVVVGYWIYQMHLIWDRRNDQPMPPAYVWDTGNYWTWDYVPTSGNVRQATGKGEWRTEGEARAAMEAEIYRL